MIELSYSLIPKDNIFSIARSTIGTGTGFYYVIYVTYKIGKVFHTVELGYQNDDSSRRRDYETLRNIVMTAHKKKSST